MKNQLLLFLSLCSLIATAQQELNSEIFKPLETYDGASALYFHEVIDIIEIDDGFIYINNVHGPDFQPQPAFLESYIKKTDPFLNIIDSVDTQTLGLDIPGLVLWGLTQDAQNDSLLHIWGGAEDNTLPNGRMKDFFVLHLDLDLEIISIDSFLYQESFRISPPTVNRQGNVTTSLRSYVESDSLPYSLSYLELNTQGEIINENIISNTISGSRVAPQITQLPNDAYLSIGGNNVISFFDHMFNRTGSEQYTELPYFNCNSFLNTVTIDSTIYLGTACQKNITENPNIPWSPIIGSQHVEKIFSYQDGEITETFEQAPYSSLEDLNGVSSSYYIDFNALKFNFDALYTDRFYTSAFYDNYFVSQITHRLSLHASDEVGTLRWSKHFSHPTKSYETYRVKALKDGGVLLLATFNNRNPNFSIETDVVFMRFDENGNEYTGETTSVTDLDINSLTLYPNPAQERLYIQVESSRPIKELAVYSLDGKRLIQQVGQINSVDLSAITKGMYILVAIFSDETVVRRKFVKGL